MSEKDNLPKADEKKEVETPKNEDVTVEVETVVKDKKRLADGIAGGIFLISLGVLLATGW